MLSIDLLSLFHVDLLSIIMMAMVSIIATVVCSFSKRHMQGDTRYNIFFTDLTKLIFAVSLITIADNMILFLAAWTYANFILTQLMIHKSSWQAAKASGKIAQNYFTIGSIVIGMAYAIFYATNQTLSIQQLLHQAPINWQTCTALVMLLVGAMIQMACWPFHRWLLSSLNSPTPVSAMMHAGVINGGGFLLLRFASLYIQFPTMLHLIFIAGFLSVCLGSAWKLICHDIKRSLAASTIEQMGYMLMQFGLGLFGCAFAHIIFHGMLKSYLFLNASNTSLNLRFDKKLQPTFFSWSIATLFGLTATYLFAITNGLPCNFFDPHLFIYVTIFTTIAQLGLIILDHNVWANIPFAALAAGVVTTIYAVINTAIDLIMPSSLHLAWNRINGIELTVFIILCLGWFFVLYCKYYQQAINLPNWALCLYVKLLNASQPDPSTTTPCRKGYDYV